jgi:glycosyltransferase involved in cell wall biosynthesis
MNILITGAGGFIRSVGNIGKVQNLENVIRGFALAAKSHDRIRLNIIGDGSNLEALKKIVKEESIANVYENPAEYPAINGGDECGAGVRGMQSPSTLFLRCPAF